MSDLPEKRKLIEALSGKSASYILNAAYKITGHPMAMFDTSYNVLAYTGGIITDDPLWNELTASGGFSHATVDFFLKEGFVKAFAESETVAEMKTEKLKYDRMDGKLFDKDNVQLGNIIAVACFKPFETGDKELLELLCEIVSVRFRNSEYYKLIDKVYKESLINKLLDGAAPEGKCTKAAASLYKGLKANLYLAVADISKYEDTVTHLAYFRDLFRKLQSGHKYFIHLNYIVIIIGTDRLVLSVKNDLGALNWFFSKNRIYAGVSGRFQSFEGMKQAYGEAVCALNYGLKSMRDQHIFVFDNYRVEYFLDSNDYKLHNGNQIVSMAEEYDRKNDTAFLRVIYIYLLYGMNADAAARALGTEPAKLSSGLKAIEELFEIDWTDGDMLTNIFLSIKALDKIP